MANRTAIFPGTFDPFTTGHLDLVERGRHLFDKLIIAIGVNSNKKRIVSTEVMVEKITELIKDFDNVEVQTYEGLTAEYARTVNAKFILRGLRNSTDLNYESPIAKVNSDLNNELESIFLISKPELSYVSSSIVRDLLRYGKDISGYLPYEL